MSNYTLKREKLLALFSKVGVSTGQGMSADFLTPLSEGEKTNGGDFSSEEIVIAELMAHPQSVVRTTRLDADDDTLADAYFYMAGGHFASITLEESGYILSPLADLEALINNVGNMLPLRPDPDTVRTRILLDMNDFIDVNSLLSDWDSVTAEALLEASGMETFEAINLADSVESQEWNGLISFLFFKDDNLSRERNMWVLQGPDTSWLGYVDLDTGKMVVQAANNEVIADISLRIWKALDESQAQL